MFFHTNDLEGYVSEIASLAKEFIMYVNDFSELEKNLRTEAEIFSNKLDERTKYFVRNLGIEKIAPGSHENIHEMIVEYLQRGERALVPADEMISKIEGIFIGKLVDSPEIYNEEEIREIAKTYFPLVEDSIDKSSRLYRPDIFALLNPRQKKLITLSQNPRA